MTEPKVLVYDIEASNLKAQFGFTLCVGYKWLDQKKIYCPTIDDYEGRSYLDQEAKMLADFHKVYSSADMVVGHYIEGFDRSFLNARLMKGGRHEPLPPTTVIPAVDTCLKAKQIGIRKSLQNMCAWYGIKDEKTPVDGDIWIEAIRGNKKAMAQVKSHCIADVRMTATLYEHIRPMMRTHPRLKGYENCRVCGSGNLQNRGTALSSLKGIQQRVQCLDCAAWSSYPKGSSPV